MLPIHDLLSRIRWDREFGRGFFEIGYLDHVGQRIIRVSLARIVFEQGDRFFFNMESETGETLTIPLHRIREVYRDGVTIWHRPC